MALLQKGYLGSTALWKNKDWFEATSPQVIDYVGSAVTVTANTAAHTKGSWSQLVASTSANSSLLFFEIINVATSGANTATLLDIATGASGSETAIVSNLAIGGAFGALIAFPYKLASGTRLSARIQSVVTGGKTA
ncbi:hypothetical protein EBZ37_10695 [bacterium]|nr:hypothetical protein [bacterium]